jgi:hypothetical protein
MREPRLRRFRPVSPASSSTSHHSWGNAVKMSHLTKSILALLLLASPLAEAELRAPSGFEPVPVFEDEGLVGRRGGHQPPPATRAPAQEAAVPSAGSVQPAAAAQAQSKPVTVPTVEPAPVAPPASAAQTEPAKAQAIPEAPSSALQGLLMENYYIGVIILAVAGLVLWSSRDPASKMPESRPGSTEVPGPAPVDSGVARYIRNLEVSARPATAETGVSRYLRTQYR